MKEFIDSLYQFERRPVYAIYGDMDNDYGFGCMDKISIALDLGFEIEPSGVVWTVVPPHFKTVEEVECFPWKITLDGIQAQKELAGVKDWVEHASYHQGGGSFGPLTVTSCILGISECLRMCRKNPAVLHAVLRRVTDYMILLAQEEEKLGAKSYWIAEPVASLLSPKMCREFCIPYLKEIFDAIQMPGVLHVCGNTDRHTNALLESGAQALSIDWCTNLADCLALAPEDVVVMGNIDPVLLLQGTKEEITAKTLEILETAHNYKNFVMATGCQVPGDSPRENVELFVELSKNAPIRTNDEYKAISKLVSIYFSNGESTMTHFAEENNISLLLLDVASDVIQKRLTALEKYPD